MIGFSAHGKGACGSAADGGPSDALSSGASSGRCAARRLGRRRFDSSPHAPLLAILLCAASPARADCLPVDGSADLRCSPETLEAWRTATLDAERDLTACTAKVDRLEPANKQLAAELAQRIDGPTWQTVALAGVGGLALGVIVALLAK